MKENNLVVEFMGLPGSGKTTLSRELRNLLKCRNIEVVIPTLAISSKPLLLRAFLKIYNAVREIVSWPIITFRYFKLIYRTKQRSCADFLKVYLNILYILNLIRTTPRKEDIVLLDQGLFQGLWSVGFSSGIDITGKIQKIPISNFPDIVIRVNCSSEVIKKRLLRREERNSRLGLNMDEYENSFEKQKVLLETITNVIEKEDIEYIEVDNNNEKDFENNLNKLSHLIFEQIRKTS